MLKYFCEPTYIYYPPNYSISRLNKRQIVNFINFINELNTIFVLHLIGKRYNNIQEPILKRSQLQTGSSSS